MIIKSIFASAALLLVSCREEVPVAVKHVPLDMDYFATIEQGSHMWEIGDEISVFNGIESCPNTLYKVDRVDGARAALKTLSIKTEAQDAYAALYPYDENASLVAGGINYKFPATQECKTGKEYENLLPYVAWSKDGNLSFRAVGGFLKISLTGEASISRIVISAERISGDSRIDAETGTVSMMSSASDEIVLDLTGTAPLTDIPSEFIAVVPPALYEKISYTITDTDGMNCVFEESDIPVENLKIADGLNAEYKIETGDEFVNLSDAGKANSYMVNGIGNFCFDACMPDGTPVDGSQARWVYATSGLWESDEEAKIDAMMTDIRYEDGKILFTVPAPFTPGNVVMSLTDDEGNIAYTWHLWLCTAVSDMAVGEHLVMDRNLGASYVFGLTGDSKQIDASRGLFYQWGRKDPFPGPRKDVSSDESAAFQKDGNMTFYTINTGMPTVGENFNATKTIADFEKTTACASRYPVTMLNNNDYLPSKENQNGDGSDYVWAAADDPCPYGYHVGTKEELGEILSKCTQEVVDENVCIYAGGGLAIPNSGYRSNTGILKRGTRFYSGNGNISNVKHGWWFTYSTGAFAGQGGNQVHSASIRCVRNR